MVLVGDARGKVAILVDDMADTCGTIVQVVSSNIKYKIQNTKYKIQNTKYKILFPAKCANGS